MDAFKVLRDDHEKTNKLMDRLASVSPSAKHTRQNLFNELKRELEIHSRIEQEIFYPRLIQVEENMELVDESLHDHQTVQQILDEMEEMEPDEADWDDMIDELRVNLLHHMEEEETDLFERARQMMPQATWDDVGDQLQRRKEQLQKQM